MDIWIVEQSDYMGIGIIRGKRWGKLKMLLDGEISNNVKA